MSAATLSPAAATGRSALPKPDRLEAVDMLRGLVMVIMALDHVRDYFSNRLFDNPVDLATTTEGIFLTRWITHYCAPTFIFLAGAGAFLSGARGQPRREVAWFLLSRGLWLVLLELTVVRLSWMFNWDWHHHGAGVFWSIGWSMVVLSGLVYLPTGVVTALGVGMIACHNLFDRYTAADLGLKRWLWMILHQPGEESLGGNFTFGTGYCLIPWVGVMAAGYGFGELLRTDRAARRKWMIVLGAGLTLSFIALRFVNVYGDPKPWSVQRNEIFTFFSFLNVTKYPPSLLYLLMTLGPAILALAIFDRPLGKVAKPFIIFGRVPLFFYLLHIPLIHGGIVLLDCLRYGWSPQAADGPWAVKPSDSLPGYGISLPMVYVVWIIVVLMLYPVCRWFAEVKRRRRDVWLRYL